MLRPVSTSSASANVAPVAVREAAAVEIAAEESRASVASVAASPVAQQNKPEPSAIFRYNSFEFVYRQDIGRIILVGQSPETGERVVQVPSEQVLRAYEQTVRAERALTKSQPQVTGGFAPQSGGSSAASGTSSGGGSAAQLAQSLAAVVGTGGGGSGSGGFVSLSA